jgi:hypothetical protein
MNIHRLNTKDDQGAESATDRSVQDPFLPRFQLRNPQNAATSFTDAQLVAIKQIFDQQGGGNHKVDVRVSLPPLFRRYYFAIFSGTEKHSRVRRRSEARLHPIFRAANKVFLSLLLVFALFSVIGFLFALDIVWEPPNHHESSLEIPKPPPHHQNRL